MRFRRSAHPVRIEMRVLLLGTAGTEPSFRSWQLTLGQVGVPFDAIAVGAQGWRVSLSSVSGHPRFQAVILATGALFDEVLTKTEQEELEALERDFGIRRLTAYAVPGPARGLQAPTWAGPLDRVSAGLTPSGRRVFPYLRGPLPIDPGSWGYLAAPVSGECFTPSSSPPTGRGWWESTARPTGARRWSRRSTRTPLRCRPTCCAVASWRG